MSTNIAEADSNSLATLIGIAEEKSPRPWLPEELGSILRHQLDSPLLFDLNAIDADGKFTLDRQTCWVDGMELHTFGHLFSHPHPPISLLRLTKDFAKSSDVRDTSPLPPEVATVLYFGAIAVAWLRCEENISRLTPQEIRGGFEWSMQQPWLTVDLRETMRQAATLLSSKDD